MSARAHAVLKMLKDEDTQAYLVTILVALGVNQTQGVANDFTRAVQPPRGGVVINHVLTEEATNTEFYRSRREMQQKCMEEIEETYSGSMSIARASRSR